MVRLIISIALLLPPAAAGAATVEDFMVDHEGIAPSLDQEG
jgi:hypothetical protein